MNTKLLTPQAAESPAKVAGWQGYTLQQLRYRRAYIAARLELEKEQLLRDFQTEKSVMASPMGIISGIGSAFKYLNWGILGWQAVKTVGSIFGKKKG